MQSRALMAAVVVILGLTAGVLAGCFSKHEPTASSQGVCRFPLGEGVPGSTLIVIRDFTFGPADVRVQAGERITWINCDEDQHTSTANGGQWASPLLSPGDGFTQSFSTSGEFTYHCEPHPFMTGRVIVE